MTTVFVIVVLAILLGLAASSRGDIDGPMGRGGNS